MFDHIMTLLKKLKLHGMANAFDRQNEQPGTYDELSFAERFQLLIDSEITERDSRKQDRLIRAAKFKPISTINTLAVLNEN